MHASGHDREIQATLEATFDFVNALRDGDLDARGLLAAHGFTRASTASATALGRVERRLRDLLPTLVALPNADPDTVVADVNERLAVLPIAPSLTDHESSGLHVHWTPDGAAFDDQVIADVLMAIALELCDHGTTRIGVCGADDCEHLFYDGTRNSSRRFCDDPRCASRTHTAAHRARRRAR